MFIGNNTIIEVVNDLDSVGGNFSERSDSDTCKVHSPFSSSSSSDKETVIHPEPDRGGNRTCRPPPKQADTYFELGRKEKIQMVFRNLYSPVYQG
jgi:hypothetical protein